MTAKRKAFAARMKRTRPSEHLLVMQVSQPMEEQRPGVVTGTHDGVLDVEQLVEQNHSMLVRVCYVITGDGEMAADAVQNAWTIAFRKLNQLRSHTAVKRWLVSIAANEARALLRTERRVARTRQALREAAQSSSETGWPEWGHLIEGSSPNDRQLLALSYIAGLTSAEIGSILGLSAEGVRTRKARLIRHLREEMTR